MVGGSANVMSGKLYDTDGEVNADSRVSYTHAGNEDKFFLMISDPDDKELYTLRVDIKTGESVIEFLPNPNDGGVFDEPQKPPTSESGIDNRQVAPADRATMPASGFRMKVQPITDASFRNQFGSQTQERVNGIFEHVKTFFQHSSLGTKYELDIASVNEYSGTLRATGNNLNTLNNYVGSISGLANTYALLSMRDNSGAAGIAWLGTVCGSKAYRTNINEYYYNDLDTAQIVAHEIGHNLNMDHDFNGSPSNKRYSSSGALCTGINTIMDYYQPDPASWSACSVEDITSYYNSVGPSTYGSSCMTLLGDDTATTTPAPTTTTTSNDDTTTTGADQTTTTTGSTSGCGSPQWANDKYCDDENNNASCNWDGGACCNNNQSYWDHFCTACECLDPNAQDGATTTAPCKDLKKAKRCNRVKKRGRCSRKWAKKNCKKTCGHC